MSYVPVKVYRNDEIRRFLLEAGEDKRFSFQRLLSQMQQVYPNLDARRIRISWKDTDGELVVMSSDLELTEAIRSMPPNDQMLRLHLVGAEDDAAEMVAAVTPEVVVILQDQPQQREKPQGPEGENRQRDAEEAMDQEPTRHRGIICDGCSGGIWDIRHKCLTCPNYDLCSECVQKGTHDEHPMIRIASPKDKSWKMAFVTAQVPFPFLHRHHGHGRHGHFLRPPHGHGPFPLVPPPHQLSPPQGPIAHGPFPPPPPGFAATGQTPPSQPPGPDAPFLGSFGRGWWHHRGSERCRRHCHNLAKLQLQREKKGEESAAQEKPQQQKEGTNLFNPQELARDLSETLTTVLNAFGIPVSTPNDTTAPKHPETASAPNSTTAATASAPSENVRAATHPDPKIAAALNYMLAMGYRNDGGWLTTLLEEKQGDISAVLDLLHPNSGQ